MQVTYIIQSKYYNGDDYMTKLNTLQEVADDLLEIAKDDHDSTHNDYRIDSKQISVTTEEM